jgi:cysteine desulfurase
MWQKNVRYLDYNATSGISKTVREKLSALLSEPDVLANPSSRHRLGQRSRKILYDATLSVAKSLSGDHLESISPDDLLFTSSGTEANQSVLKTILNEVSLLIVGAGEHSASRDIADSQSKVKVEALPLLPSGQYDFEALEKLLMSALANGIQSVGLSLTLANNETGVLLDTQKLNSILQNTKLKVHVHLDGAQVWGKHAFHLKATGAHYITFSAHKIGAPSGTGLIWMQKNTAFSPLILGTQARGLRGGSENLLGIAATGFAAETLNPKKFAEVTRPLIERLEKGLGTIGHPIKIWGKESARVPNTSRFSVLNFKSYENWVELLDLKGFAVSHGSACKAQIIEPSVVLLKMGATHEEALNSLRISVGPDNTLDDMDAFIIALKQILLRKSEVGE